MLWENTVCRLCVHVLLSIHRVLQIITHCCQPWIIVLPRQRRKGHSNYPVEMRVFCRKCGDTIEDVTYCILYMDAFWGRPTFCMILGDLLFSSAPCCENSCWMDQISVFTIHPLFTLVQTRVNTKQWLLEIFISPGSFTLIRSLSRIKL